MASKGFHINWKEILLALGSVVLVLAGFAAWLIDRADAAVSEHVSSPNPHPGIEAHFEALEQKIDKVLWYLIDDRSKRSVDLNAPQTTPHPDPAKHKGSR